MFDLAPRGEILHKKAIQGLFPGMISRGGSRGGLDTAHLGAGLCFNCEWAGTPKCQCFTGKREKTLNAPGKEGAKLRKDQAAAFNFYFFVL